mgnify:CR=1 FL=1
MPLVFMSPLANKRVCLSAQWQKITLFLIYFIVTTYSLTITQVQEEHLAL